MTNIINSRGISPASVVKMFARWFLGSARWGLVSGFNDYETITEKASVS